MLDPATDVILDGGPSPVGVESTIVDCTRRPAADPAPRRHPDRDDRRTARRPARRRQRTLAGRRDGRRRTTPRALGFTSSTSRATPRPPPNDWARRGIDVRVIDGTDDLVRYAHNLYAELRDADSDGCTRHHRRPAPADRPRPRHPRPSPEGRRPPLTVHCVPRPRRPLLAASSLALGRSHLFR